MAISNDNVIWMDGVMMPWRDANVSKKAAESTGECYHAKFSNGKRMGSFNPQGNGRRVR